MLGVSQVSSASQLSMKRFKLVVDAQCLTAEGMFRFVFTQKYDKDIFFMSLRSLLLSGQNPIENKPENFFYLQLSSVRIYQKKSFKDFFCQQNGAIKSCWV